MQDHLVNPGVSTGIVRSSDKSTKLSSQFSPQISPPLLSRVGSLLSVASALRISPLVQNSTGYRTVRSDYPV
ncbi:hypothetical protein AHF37_12085 [Paragonimus kellicotti]|nr:hypothetical protein AHF37_12085 [Paragonimus kellicotti]